MPGCNTSITAGTKLLDAVVLQVMLNIESGGGREKARTSGYNIKRGPYLSKESLGETTFLQRTTTSICYDHRAQVFAGSTAPECITSAAVAGWLLKVQQSQVSCIHTLQMCTWEERD